MRADLESVLENEYSFMKNVYVETGDGWYQIVYHMCREINNAYSKYDLKPDIIVAILSRKMEDWCSCIIMILILILKIKHIS